MFNLIKSNRMESLMQGLIEVLETPLNDPMAPEWIGVQSRGMKQWVSAQMADYFGVCANVEFMSPRQIINWALGQVGPDELELNPEILTWALFDALSLDGISPSDHGVFQPVSHYLSQDPGGQKRVMLARKLARVMDNYQIFRPQMLLAWEDGEPLAHPGDGVEEWQSRLWKQMSPKLPKVRLHRRMHEFLERAGQGNFPTMPQRICLFGISTLPPAFIEVLSTLAGATEIYQFLLTPSDQFFSYIRSPRENLSIQRHTPDLEENYFEIGNPLLASLGRSVREFQDGLEEAPYQEPLGDFFLDPLNDGGHCLLHILQSDIMGLVHRREGGVDEPVPVAPEDDSLGIHICHSPMREAQVVKDLLLDAFDRNPDLNPHEIIVMMPDIEAYTPFIEAVFSSEFPLPYAVSDRRKKLESQTLEVFMKVLGLVGSRLELTPILDLLLCPAVAEKFDIQFMEVELLEDAARRAGILWGKDGSHREEMTGAGYGENTWEFGFKRLFTGLAAVEGRQELMSEVLPAPLFEGVEADLLGRFAHFSHTLFDMLSLMEGDRRPVQWSRDLARLIRSLMGGTDAPGSDLVFLLCTVGEMGEEAGHAGFDRDISFEAVKQILEGKLDQRIAQGAFLSGGITFCNLMPMRSIPFKIVCLMGMDEASFPRQAAESGFDLMGRHPQRGDKKGRDEDRYLFLESLLSAREKLIITYTGLGIKDNGEIPCSGVVSELVDVVNQSFSFGEGEKWILEHGIHPFLPRYFSGDPKLFSFSRRQFKLASQRRLQAIHGDGQETMVQSGRAEPIPASAETMDVSLKDLIRFFRMPGRAFMVDELKITLGELEPPPQDRESFDLDFLDQYGLGRDLLNLELAESPGEPARTVPELVHDLYPRARAQGCLPFGEQGRMCWEGVVQDVVSMRDQVRSCEMPDLNPVRLSIDLDMGDFRIIGQAEDLFQLGNTDEYHCFHVGFSSLGPERLLSMWIHHLVVSQALEARGGKLSSMVLGKDPDAGKRPGIRIYGSLDGNDSSLETLMEIYGRGRMSFIPFFPRSCFALARGLEKQGFDTGKESLSKALYKASNAWFNAHSNYGESTDRYLSLYLSSPQGPINPFADVETLLAWDIPALALAVFKPLLENLDRLP
ncbi:MAG: exodeoxyribonuclease V subunit gamma [Desulfobacterales bacterium]|nr:exodeoxyribonuclease V subunit gamma [Desulfobacterales bacterium]